MQMRQRTVYTLLAISLFVCALGGALYLWAQAAPEVARLLPESDAIVYFNVKALRAATHFDQRPVSPASFQGFIDATGILPERDLDSVAFALHRMADPRGPNGAVGYSEAFAGHFDHKRLDAYFAAQASSRESYGGHTIYALPSEGRTVRIALVGSDMVAASNMPTPEQIHSILDREGAAASPFAGSSLLNALYGEVPAFSSAWAVGAIGLPFASSGRIKAFGLELPLAGDTPFVASLRYTMALHLRIDGLAATDEQASRTAKTLNGMLDLARGFELVGPENRTAEERALRDLVSSIEIEQHGSRTALTATVPAAALKLLMSGQR